MSPREVIARTLHRADVEPRRFDPHWNVHEWDDLSDPAKVYWWQLADAVIDALEKMEVTEAMQAAYSDITLELMDAHGWRAMVGAMRDE
jgi:hypothetical protein